MTTANAGAYSRHDHDPAQPCTCDRRDERPATRHVLVLGRWRHLCARHAVAYSDLPSHRGDTCSGVIELQRQVDLGLVPA